MSYGRMLSMNRGRKNSDGRRDGNDRYEGERAYYDDGVYDYDRYRRKDGRFAPKPRRMEYDDGEQMAFYDRDGRRHYDNGRYAPMRDEYNGDGKMKIGFAPPSNGNPIYPGDRGGQYDVYPGEVRYSGYKDDERRQREKWEEERRKHERMGYVGDDDEYFFKLKGKFGRRGEGGVEEMRMMMREIMPAHMTREMAEEWTRQMKNEDGTRGPHWSMEQIEQLRQQKKELQEFDLPTLFAVMNMMYSDYCGAAKKFNVNNIDFYVCMAKAWLDDEDAGAGKAKTAIYYECIAK